MGERGRERETVTSLKETAGGAFILHGTEVLNPGVVSGVRLGNTQ